MNTSGRVGEGDAQVRLRLTTMVVEGPAAKTKRARRGMMMAIVRAVVTVTTTRHTNTLRCLT